MITSPTYFRRTTSIKVLGFFMLAIFSVTVPFSHTENVAHAQIPVTDAANLTANTVTSVNATSQTVVEKILNGLAWTVAKLTVQSITRSTVNWINSGFQGSPAFVSDLQSNLKYLGDAVANDFFNQLNKTVVDSTGFNIKSPFQDQISQQLRAQYYKQTSGLLGLSAYDLSGHSADPKAFLNGNFSQGGFDAFLSASQNPANNPFGAYKLASDQLWASIDAAAQQRTAELGWGKGFSSWRGACNSVTDASSPANNGGNTTTVDTAGLSNTANNAINAALGTPSTAGTPAAAAPVSLSKAEQCTGNSVKTPGSVIEDQLENSLGTGIRQLELADSINEIVGALMGQLVNKVLGSGGLLGASQPSSGGGSSYIDQATAPSQLSTVVASLADGVTQNIANDRTAVSTYQTNWQTILTAANAAKQSCGATPEITAAITQATASVASSTAALALIDTTNTTIQNANQSTSNDKTTVIANAVSDYQNKYLASPLIPTAEQQSDAVIESSDSGTSTPMSLYTRMTNLAQSCHAQ